VPRQTTWTFDRLDTIGGLPVKVDGNPKVIETPLGRAVEFDGVDDSIYIDQHPLAGAEQFTFEAIFVQTAARPSSAGFTSPSAARQPANSSH